MALFCLRGYLGFALKTTRWTLSIAPQAKPLLTGQSAKTPIMALWHEMLPLAPALWWWAEPHSPRLRLSVIISRNRDGRIIADIVAPWRIWSITGSSNSKGKSKGGAAAFRRMLATLHSGGVVAITPDGPRGPRRVVQPGAIALAIAAKQPIVPMGGTCFGVRLKTWDNLLLPLPFGKGHLVCGNPLYIERTAKNEDARLSEALSTQMRYATQTQESLPGYEHIQVSLKPFDHTPSRLWYDLATLIAPALPFYLRWRQRRGKEIASRIREKMGFASLTRPAGQLLWFHAASVGEVLSILSLVDECLKHRSQCRALITTGTVTAAALLKERIQSSLYAKRIGHQFMPLDVPRWGVRFLEHWRPDAIVFTESDLWPNLIGLCHARNIPVCLVNGRMSERSFQAWQKVPAVARRMLERFAWISPRSAPDAEHFVQLGASAVGPIGDIKLVAHPLPFNAEHLRAVKEQIGKRPVFLAASTHEGEEAVLVQALEVLRKDYPTLLMIIVPRHPERGGAVSALCGGAPRRSCGKWPTEKNAIWVCDTLGELGLFYRVANCAFIGNSLKVGKAGGGGHNPFEAVRLSCPLATGPLVQNFQMAFQELKPAIATIYNVSDLVHWVSEMLSKPHAVEAQAEKAQNLLMQNSALLHELVRKIVALLIA